MVTLQGTKGKPARAPRRNGTATVFGAGIAGASTALALQERGVETTLVDPWDPGHLRAASSGDHRILRTSHGSDELYTAWAKESRLRWLEFQERRGTQLFVQSGAVMLAHERDSSWEEASAATLGRLGIPSFRVSAEELRVRLPVLDTAGIAFGLWEPESGFVFARRALLAIVEEFEDRGGSCRKGSLSAGPDEVPLLDGAPVGSDLVICACGAWMRDIFRRTLAPLLEIARQDVILVAPPAGSRAFDADNFPAWIDHTYPAYGIPAVGGHGFKAVINWRGLSIDVDRDDRLVSQPAIARSRRYLATRFPTLLEQPIVGQEVGQIANTPDTQFLIDAHPDHPNVTIVAGDSGHMFKHGLVLGEYAARFALGEIEGEPRFALRRRTRVAHNDRPQ
ncbi:MAG: NAD(P)/FAD-dependent oxidoreductase [Solirubrobacterales bacterium]